MSEKPQIKESFVAVPLEEVELLVFVLDGSGSMTYTDTEDKRSRADHLCELLKATLERLTTSTRSSAYRVSFVYFSDKVYVEEVGGRKYFTLNEALQLLKNPVQVAGGQSTWIAGGLRKALEIINEFDRDESLPIKKRVTVFLFTDGAENVEGKDAVRQVANEIKTHRLAPILATVSFGTEQETDKVLLKEIASEASEKQKRHLQMAGVISHLPDPNKLFIDGHVGGQITKQKAEALRNFVYVLSATRKD